VSPTSWSPHDRAERLRRAASALGDLGATAQLVSSPASVRYLSGFTGTGALVLTAAGDLHLLTDGRYELRAKGELAEAGVSATVDARRTGLGERLRDAVGPGPLLVEGPHLTAGELHGLQQVDGLELVLSDGVVEPLRLRKDDAELERIDEAAAIVRGVFADLPELVRPGMSEREVARTVERTIEDRSGERPGFPALVATGANIAAPHWAPGDDRVEEGVPVLIDAGAMVDGYRSDMTRTVVFGTASDEVVRVIEAALAAYQASADVLAADVPSEQVHHAALASLGRSGYEAAMPHPTGHNIGLDVHERPFFAVGVEDPVGDRRVVTIEPGLYLEGVGGARFEDMFLVDDGGARPLTRSQPLEVAQVLLD
jgi:Xaa-Pro aminopeptidase